MRAYQLTCGEGGVRSGDAPVLHIMNIHTYITSSISVSPRDRRILQAGHRVYQITTAAARRAALRARARRGGGGGLLEGKALPFQ